MGLHKLWLMQGKRTKNNCNKLMSKASADKAKLSKEVSIAMRLFKTTLQQVVTTSTGTLGMVQDGDIELELDFK